MAKTYQQIQEEANRLFGKGASDKKFEWRRQQQQASGLAQEKRKRGGVAGQWDRNKKIITPLAELTAGALLGPAGAAVVGGAAKGFDRPGKSGIGFDVGRGAMGALEGYTLGEVGKFAGGKLGIKPLLGAKAAPAAADVAGNMGLENVANANITATKPSAMQSILAFARDNPAVIANVATGISGAIGDRYEAEAAQRRLDLDEEMYRQEQERKNRLAQLLMPFFQQQIQQYGSQQQG